MELGRVGIWEHHMDQLPSSRSMEVAAEIEEMGFGALWIPEVLGRESFVSSAMLLGATAEMVVATGVASIWSRDAITANAALRTLTEAHPERFVLGLGVSHQVMVEDVKGLTYDKPYSSMQSYLDAMDAAPFSAVESSAPTHRVLAALGPRMLALAAERADGAHPYLVPVDHTAFAREQLGVGPLLCPEQAVVLETEPTAARDVARRHLRRYLGLPNYAGNLRRFGFTDEDLAGGGSDRLVDAVVAWGDEAAIAARVAAHHDAGADHVCIQVLGAGQHRPRVDDMRRLAPALIA